MFIFFYFHRVRTASFLFFFSPWLDLSEGMTHWQNATLLHAKNKDDLRSPPFLRVILSFCPLVSSPVCVSLSLSLSLSLVVSVGVLSCAPLCVSLSLSLSLSLSALSCLMDALG